MTKIGRENNEYVNLDKMQYYWIVQYFLTKFETFKKITMYDYTIKPMNSSWGTGHTEIKENFTQDAQNKHFFIFEFRKLMTHFAF